YAGPPTVADFDGDGRPEVAVPVTNNVYASAAGSFADPERVTLYVLGADGAEVWHKGLTPTGAGNPYIPPPTAFDFDGDGAVELVVQDQQYLYVLDGRTGATRFQFAVGNEANVITSMAPVVADVDNDGAAEVVTFATQSFGVGSPPRQGIVVIGDANDNWVHARRNWNQWLYNPAFTDENGSVPVHARNGWEVQNGVRTQVPIEGVDRFAAPDLSVSRVTVDGSNCPASAGVIARIGNGGSLQAGAGIRVAFYLGDPAAGGTLLGVRTTSRPLFPGEFEDVRFDWAAPTVGPIYVTANDPPPAARVASANLALLPDAWARSSGFLGDSTVPMNRNAYLGIDGNGNTQWTPAGGTDTDPGPHFFEVRFPFPVEVTGVAVQNQGGGATGLLGSATLTFSNGYATTIDLGTTGAGSVTVPEQTGITWVKLTASSVAAGGPGLSEFVVAGSYVPPSFLTNEGVGKRGNNVAAAGFIGVPCDPAADFTPTVFAGADRVIAEGGTLALSPAMFTDPGLLAAHAATIDWGDGSPVGVGAVTEAGGSGTVAGSHVYRRGGASTVTVHVTDPAGHVGRGTFTVLVQNLPAAVTAGPDRVAAEGQSVTLSAAFADPGVLDTHAATIDWGDGTVEAGVVAEAGGSGTVAGAHAYRDNGRYTVTVTVTDDGGAAAAARFAVQVAGQAPVVEAGSDGSIDEGGRFALAGAGFADAGLADTHTVRIDWGDGTPYGVGVVSGGPAGATVHADHVYEDGGTFTVTVVVTDDDGAVGSDTCQVVVANVAPTVNAGPDRDVAATVTLPPAWFSDPSVLDTHAATVDWGDGTAGSGSVFQWRGSGTVGGSHTYLADGAYTVTITVADDDGGRGQASFHVTAHVLNQPPAVLTEGAVTVFEGDSREFAFAFTDPNPDGAHTAALDWADGSPAGAVPLANDLGGFGTAFATHRFLDDGTFDAAFTVTDDGHLSGTGLTRVVVANRPPVVDAGADRSTGVGALLSLPAVFTDAGVLDAHVASIAWGDGSVTPAAILEANGAGTAAGQHAYAAPGTYTVVVTVTDDDGGVGSDTLLVTVFNTPPAADAGPDRAVREGDAVMLTGAFTDPDAGDPPTFRWHVVASNGQAIADGTGPTFAFTPNDNGTYTATFTVTDAAGAAASDSVVVAVANAAPSPAVGGTPATGPEGTAVALIASVSDPGAADTHTFAWAVTKNGAAFASGGGAAFGFTPDDNGTYVVTLTATDDDGAIGTDGRTIVVTNAAPTVDAGPDASVAAGAAFTRAGSFTDPGTADTFTATVDYGDGTGGQGLPLAGTAFTLAHTYAAPGTYTVTVTVTDDDGAGNTDTVQVAVTGGAQLTAAIAGPADAVRGQPRTFILTAADGSGDPTVVYNFALDWDGNGTTDQTVVGPSGTTVDHAFPAVGTFTVRMTADRSGRTATAAHAMRVTAAALQPDPCCGGTALVVGGTPCDDTIVIAPACGTGAVGVWVGCAWLGTFHPTGRVIVYAQAGNDNVQVAGGVDHPAWLYGGAGDDRLKGGGGHNVLLGGVGEDLLVGGNDRDVLIGGTGADRLVGNAADDILVAGSTAFDDDEDGLCAVLAEWSSARPYAARLANIRGTGSGSGFANRLNGNFFLQVTSAAATTTVFDDGAADVLTGASGQDWFLANVSGGGVRDRVTDLSAAEFLTDLDFILGP
ncbi:MAG TPA: PKD domain-containing protein, partial [Gemmataceae bacterium]